MDMEQLRSDLKVLEKRFDTLQKTMDEVHLAIIGNPLLNGQGGIAMRLLDAEEEIKEIRDDLIEAEKRYEERTIAIEKKQIKYNVYTAIMWACLGGVAMAIFMYALKG